MEKFNNILPDYSKAKVRSNNTTVIKREIFDSYSDCNCDKCHLKAIELWKKQKLTKK